jgi:hypothetical protein
MSKCDWWKPPGQPELAAFSCICRTSPPHSERLLETRNRSKKDPEYVFDVQILTLRFKTGSTVPIPQPVEAWAPFVPKEKLAALHAYDPKLIRHPPSGG